MLPPLADLAWPKFLPPCPYMQIWIDQNSGPYLPIPSHLPPPPYANLVDQNLGPCPPTLHPYPLICKFGLTKIRDPTPLPNHKGKIKYQQIWFDLNLDQKSSTLHPPPPQPMPLYANLDWPKFRILRPLPSTHRTPSYANLAWPKFGTLPAHPQPPPLICKFGWPKFETLPSPNPFPPIPLICKFGWPKFGTLPPPPPHTPPLKRED